MDTRIILVNNGPQSEIQYFNTNEKTEDLTWPKINSIIKIQCSKKVSNNHN